MAESVAGNSNSSLYAGTIKESMIGLACDTTFLNVAALAAASAYFY